VTGAGRLPSLSCIIKTRLAGAAHEDLVVATHHAKDGGFSLVALRRVFTHGASVG
jgi:hypothetical protein